MRPVFTIARNPFGIGITTFDALRKERDGWLEECKICHAGFAALTDTAIRIKESLETARKQNAELLTALEVAHQRVAEVESILDEVEAGVEALPEGAQLALNKISVMQKALEMVASRKLDWHSMVREARKALAASASSAEKGEA